MNNSNNNLFNKDMFQQTPQKTPSWLAPAPQAQNSSLSVQPSPMFGTQPPVPTAQPGFGAAPSNFGQTSFSSQPSQFGMQQPRPFAPSAPNQFAPALSTPLGTTPAPTTPFGTAPAMKLGSSPAFGTTTGFGTQQNTGFGTGSTVAAAPLSNTFGSTIPSSSFSMSKPQAFGQNTWAPLSQQSTWNSAGQGSKAVPYSISKMREDTGTFSDVMDITAIKEYSDRSVDEIRREDYSLSRKPIPSSGTAFAASKPYSFGSSTQQSMPLSNQQNVPLSNQQNVPLSNQQSMPLSNQQSMPLSNQQSFPLSNQQGLTFPGQQSADISTPFPSPSLGSQSLFRPAETTKPAAGINLFGGQSKPLGTPLGQPPTQLNSSLNSAGNLFSTGLLQQSPSFGTAPQPFAPSLRPGFSSFTPPVLNSQPASTTFAGAQPMNTYNQAQLCDPYLIKDIIFEKAEVQKPSIRSVLPSPVFDISRNKTSSEIEYRLPRKTNTKGLYTIPEIKGSEEPVSNLVVGFEGKGKIEYLEPVSPPPSEELDKKIRFIGDKVDVSDPPGIGMNKRARVYVEGVFPYSRMTGTSIRGIAQKWPEKGIQERFIYQLKNNTEKKFVDYDPNTGQYVYEVNHF